jgi:hypothetical protein
MSETVDDLTVEYHEGDLMTVKELDKVILSKGAWATVMFRYQDLDRKTGEFGDDKYTIRRYQKRNGEYSQRSKFNISSRAQATQIIESLTKWIDE